MELLKKYGWIALAAAGVFAALIFYSVNIPRNREANVIERTVLTVTSPLLKPVYLTSSLVGHLWDDYIALVNVRRDNQRLREEMQALTGRLATAGEFEQSNQRLQRLLEMKASVKAPVLAATIIGEDISPWFSSLVIDRGSSSGVVEGMAVVAAGGVVGQVVKVSPANSRVLLLTDHASGISATIQRSRARGVVKGNGAGLCSLEFTTREEDVKVGDVLVTSGVGGVFSKGLPLGEVTMVKRGEYGIFQTVSVRPSVNIARLEEVLVVMRSPRE